MEEKKYCVYMHIFPNNKKYIGITSSKPKYRWRNGERYSRHPKMYSAILKYGWQNVQHLVLFNNLTKAEAEQKEIELINYYKSNNIKFGYNEDGGGITHRKLSKEHIEKMRHSMSEENKIKLSKRMLGNKYNNGAQRNKIYTDKISIKIKCLETNEVFKSIIEASRVKKVNEANIHSVLKNKRKTAGGYHWKRVD